MKVLIVDDSRLARNELRRLLQKFPVVEICAEAANADQAREAIREYSPETIFLDIEMPGENGFELLASLDRVPGVIFTTAYDEFAVQAFEQNAVDYLVKPIDPGRLEKALDRAMNQSSVPRREAEEKMGPEDQVFVKDGEKCWFVKLKQIRFFETYGNYSKIYFDEEKVLVNKSLNYLEARLNPRRFFRANRQFIINLNHVKQIHPWNNEAFRVEMNCGTEIDISRRKSQRFKELLSF
jgi:two-component system, LytTR family, response regulator